jgi:copper(I)-binding protein
MSKWIVALLLLAGSVSVIAADAVQISNAWARATAPGQEVGAAYMTLKSATTLQVTQAETKIAEAVEIHEMTMKDGVMKMRMMEILDLPAGKEVHLEPGGFHFMLFDLKEPLKAGSSFDLILNIKDAQGKTSKQTVKVPVKPRQ